MHVQIASKMLSEIKRRSIDKLQDFEDEIMNGTTLSNTCKTDLIQYLQGETASEEEL